eukprot:gb/GFBE01006826.1/.p1 GENE.gb/GFBE01006826.1/~~gb/GFBE01006826.1/.p1  ORF type:complete len:387 (+),score=23.05 gb/GFBE01006826.1/:1-1161(+)
MVTCLLSTCGGAADFHIQFTSLAGSSIMSPRTTCTGSDHYMQGHHAHVASVGGPCGNSTCISRSARRRLRRLRCKARQQMTWDKDQLLALRPATLTSRSFLPADSAALRSQATCHITATTPVVKYVVVVAPSAREKVDTCTQTQTEVETREVGTQTGEDDSSDTDSFADTSSEESLHFTAESCPAGPVDSNPLVDCQETSGEDDFCRFFLGAGWEPHELDDDDFGPALPGVAVSPITAINSGDDAPVRLSMGDVVQLHGLASAELNDYYGRVTGYVKSSARYCVTMSTAVCKRAATRTKLIKRQNLRWCEAGEALEVELAVAPKLLCGRWLGSEVCLQNRTGHISAVFSRLEDSGVDESVYFVVKFDNGDYGWTSRASQSGAAPHE